MGELSQQKSNHCPMNPTLSCDERLQVIYCGYPPQEKHSVHKSIIIELVIITITPLETPYSGECFNLKICLPS